MKSVRSWHTTALPTEPGKPDWGTHPVQAGGSVAGPALRSAPFGAACWSFQQQGFLMVFCARAHKTECDTRALHIQSIKSGDKWFEYKVKMLLHGTQAMPPPILELLSARAAGFRPGRIWFVRLPRMYLRQFLCHDTPADSA